LRSRAEAISYLELELMIESQTLQHSARTAVAAVVSLLTARVFGLPEAYWAAVTTLIVMQSTLGAAVTISVRRFVGTALGAGIGALLATWFGSNVLAFGAGIFLLGIICSLLGLAHQRLAEYLDRSAYRFGSIALAIVMLVVRDKSPWIVALHRFIEVSIGIVVGLLLTILSPERTREST
jgi:uncharacterized membrane protein YccC